MLGPTEQVELLAQRIWSEWLTLGDTMRIAEQLGYPKNEYGWATQFDGLKWGDLPENVKDRVRNGGTEIVLVQTTPQTEVTRYLVTLFRSWSACAPPDAVQCRMALHGMTKESAWSCSSILAISSTLTD
jgi:hypothetical protein